MISKHISYKEGVYSTTALRRNIENKPNEEQLANMKLIGEKIFEPLREYVGSTRSQHCKGQAMDVDDTFGYKTNAQMYDFIKHNLDFDQMIWEFGDDDNPNWVHVSYVSPDKNRQVCLKAYKQNGRTKYMTI